MNNLTFVIRDNRSFETYSIEKDLTTVRDLNEALNEKGVDTSNIQYYEPKSQTNQLSSEVDAKLITQHPVTGRNGEQCIIFSITTAGKNIDGGCEDRADLQRYVRENNLKHKAKNYGKHNYTHLSNKELLEIVDEHRMAFVRAEEDADNFFDIVEECVDEISLERDVTKLLKDRLKHLNVKKAIVSVMFVREEYVKDNLPLNEDEVTNALK